MTFGRLAFLYGACVVAFLGIDAVWLTLMTPRFYQPRLGGLLAAQPKLGVAAVFYLLYVVGIVALAVLPGIRGESAAASLWRGALFGLLAYATYDLTNLSTIRNWPWDLSVVDMAWGTALTGAVSIVGYYTGRWLGL